MNNAGKPIPGAGAIKNGTLRRRQGRGAAGQGEGLPRLRRADPGDLVRLSRGADGSIRVGPGSGRGAWLCGPPDTAACLEAAIRRRALDRALRGTVPADEIEALGARLGDTSGTEP